jgi:hypothetical protein
MFKPHFGDQNIHAKNCQNVLDFVKNLNRGLNPHARYTSGVWTRNTLILKNEYTEYIIGTGQIPWYIN